MSSSSSPASPLPHPGARVGPLELANALAACVLSARLTSKHRQWAAKQLVQALAATGRDAHNRPQTYSDLAGDLRKSSLKRLEGHYNKVRRVRRFSFLKSGCVSFLLSFLSVILICNSFILTTRKDVLHASFLLSTKTVIIVVVFLTV